ncbi:putative acetyltransferase [Actinoplanes campanulatus]|uniref:Putative acetyltransferase n=1 Tax=Actinoplanes campanulatus TaxID=113559 RepID=A0A7W5FHE0_9ACTN|nr:GNAT family N-acetyltransferase [Actinoplanes campanulatus]MBB3098573.1 putative acetyltransferase [Actinoplanes campanulatus]GGN35956.1 N-acetyltransferase [Actinoplanes campanulatus]GID39267.1 N-acetyltransferase [Actinoplanes campanulatus]
MTLRITIDDLTGPDIAALLQQHLDDMRATSPPDSKHALDLDGLRTPDITLWTAHDGPHLVGCAALKHHDPTTAEIKSMRTATTAQRRGVATTLLQHLITQARHRHYTDLYLETGTADYFAPARALYQRFGFRTCPPFADYRPDPHSTHMHLTL